MSRQERAVIVPLDNRPVTYLLPQLITAVAGIEAFVPPRELMGSLKAPAKLNELNNWLEDVLQKERPTALFICLDTILYGGMVPWSRVSLEPVEDVFTHVGAISRWKALSGNQVKVFAQSSIMRIPDYDDAAEEPEYWAQYGRKIFKWSALQHQKKLGMIKSDAELLAVEREIPDVVRKDFLWRRKRNFEVNRKLVEYANSGDIDYLVFSQDDTGEFGLNVDEKVQLVEQAVKRGAKNIVAYAGADEVLLSLVSRWLATTGVTPPRVSLQFSPPGGASVSSNYEGQSIGESLRNQIAAAGLALDEGVQERKPDFNVIVHTSGTEQGDHIWLPGHPDRRNLDTKAAAEHTINLLAKSDLPCVLCDVAYSNGADPVLVEKLFENKSLLKKLWAYSAWNTTGNAVGCALALATACWFAQQNDKLRENVDSLKRSLFVRFADDWAYQTQVRGQLAQKPDLEKMRNLMSPYLKKIEELLEVDLGPVTLSLPWERTFEVEVGLGVLTKC